MRFTVETWAPEYGVPMEAEPGEAAVVPDLDVEVSAAAWRPLAPAVGAAHDVLFVDGVRRVDAGLWIEVGGEAVLGLCATYAAGAVRCNGAATVVGARIERGVFTSARGAADVVTRHARYEVKATGGATPPELWLGIQQRMGALEGRMSAEHADAQLVVVDGPLSHHQQVGGAVGLVKTQHVHYLPPGSRGILADLTPGRRTPLFLVTTGRSTFSWYLRLANAPGPSGGLVRCEISGDRSVADASMIADRVTATLPRFASEEHKDPRAPQNLYPIGGLERELRRRLGDQRLLYRALRQAAAT